MPPRTLVEMERDANGIFQATQNHRQGVDSNFQAVLDHNETGSRYLADIQRLSDQSSQDYDQLVEIHNQMVEIQKMVDGFATESQENARQLDELMQKAQQICGQIYVNFIAATEISNEIENLLRASETDLASVQSYHGSARINIDRIQEIAQNFSVQLGNAQTYEDQYESELGRIRNECMALGHSSI